MNILFTKRFSNDLDTIRNESSIKKRLLQVIERIKEGDSLTDIPDVRKIEGYSNYFRIRIGDYRLGVKLTENKLEMIRFLHRKEIYRRFPQ